MRVENVLKNVLELTHGLLWLLFCNRYFRGGVPSCLVCLLDRSGHTHTHTHARTHAHRHARMHARTHAHTHARTHQRNALSHTQLNTHKTQAHTRLCKYARTLPLLPSTPLSFPLSLSHIFRSQEARRCFRWFSSLHTRGHTHTHTCKQTDTRLLSHAKIQRAK